MPIVHDYTNIDVVNVASARRKLGIVEVDFTPAIEVEEAARVAADAAEARTRDDADRSETSARIAADAALQVQLNALPTLSVPTTNPYTFTNDTPLRTIDVATATPTDTLNCLASLVADLRAAGILPP